MFAKYSVLTSMLVLLSACSSITGTTGQSVSLQTRDKAGAEVPGAACELTNSKGKWFVTTPGSVQIRRSNDDMIVQCSKTGYESGHASVVSDTKGSMFGNIVFGGGIGAVVDHNTGAAYEYPTLIQVVMGIFTKVEVPKSTATQTGNIPANGPQSAVAPTPTVTTSGTPAIAEARGGDSNSLDTKLQELKRLREANLITQEVYLQRQHQVLDGK